jgi:hypothetical protein
MERDSKLKVAIETDKKPQDGGASEITKVWTPHPEKQADMPVNPKKKGDAGKSKQPEKRGK